MPWVCRGAPEDSSFPVLLADRGALGPVGGGLRAADAGLAFLWTHDQTLLTWMSRMPTSEAQTFTGDSAPTSGASETDAPQGPSVRECSDRLSVMERELQELRVRFANVTRRSSAGTNH